jgi:hypothetical protein
VGLRFVAFERVGAADTPDNWGIAASLTCSIDGECLAARVVAVGYSHCCPELVLCLFEGSCIDEDDIVA